MNIKINYDSPLSIKNFLHIRNINIQKRFGQNFLIDSAARSFLQSALNINACDTVWEIGAGLGAMTSGLLQSGAAVTVFEIDRAYCTILKDFFGDEKRFSLVEGDVLKTYLQTYELADGAPQKKHLYMLGNLPYNIAAVIIAKFIESGIHFERAVCTVQKEVAMRLAAKPDTPNYASLSVLCSSVYDVKVLKVMGGKMFFPAPNVDSACVLFQKKSDDTKKQIPKIFYPLVRCLFAAKRKTILNNLNVFLETKFDKNVLQNAEQNISTKDFCVCLLNKINIDTQQRAANLSLDQFLAIANALI
ncbi:MAG: 16S rRNA (adenine(1518)-N(6)/adenine(1519)-N(6)) -dimethyltransferase RsmA [Termitinemataceae bacterium]|nr:MAG: 16S rRNA (adenine(1518)-N(6)/adenine(1519)-N(6)) -dimethyltransferase RsmA [Termitinemataceae bacterium]